MPVFDEFGGGWKVKGGDPGARMVNKLTRSNYQLIVLPFVALATGKMPDNVQQPTDVIRSTRMADCMSALGRN